MSLAHCINVKVDKAEKAKWTPKLWRSLPSVWETLFQNNGEGMYVSIIQSAQNDFISRMISLLTGKFSHCFHMYYSENLQAKITTDEYNRLIANWQIYYGISKGMAEENFLDTKVLILASADRNGMNYPDFGVYAGRQQCVKKLYTIPPQNDIMLRWYLSEKIMTKIYDYCGLIFFRLIDDPQAYFCSEIVYDAGDKVGYKMAESDSPSPTDIYKYTNNGLTIFSNV